MPRNPNNPTPGQVLDRVRVLRAESESRAQSAADKVRARYSARELELLSTLSKPERAMVEHALESFFSESDQ